MDFSIDEIGKNISDAVKKPGFNKGTLLLVGGVGVAGFVLVQKMRTPDTPSDTLTMEMPVGVDQQVGQQMSNLYDILQGEINKGMSTVYQDINSVLGDYGANLGDLTNQVTHRFEEIEKKLQDDAVKDATEKNNPVRLGWGIGFGNTPVEQFEAKRLGQLAKQDPYYRDLEIERTNNVIQNRIDQGLDTTRQQKYLTQLTGGGPV